MTHELDLQITDLARGGAGVAREASGRVIFVPYTAPGDRVRVRIIEEDKNYAQAEIVEILEKSPHRIEPRCAVFGRCGGCQWQHLPYELQWKTKVLGSRHALKRVGVAAPADWDEFPAEQAWNYRNRVQLRGVGESLGFFARGSNTLVPIETCAIARPEINSKLADLRARGKELAKPYKVEVEAEPYREFWNARHAQGGFQQVHDAQDEVLKSWVKGRLSSHRGVLLDLFGGLGNLSLSLAPELLEVHCVDFGSPSGERIPVGTPQNFHFHRIGVVPFLEGFRSDAEIQVIMDPPRDGVGRDLKAVIRELARLRVKKLLLIGCEPDSWARDLAGLGRAGWEVARCAAFDLFPQTIHVESAAELNSAVIF